MNLSPKKVEMAIHDALRSSKHITCLKVVNTIQKNTRTVNVIALAVTASKLTECIFD